MAFDVSWLLEKRIVYARVRGDLTVDELQVIVDAVAEDISAGSSPVHAILDLTHVEKFPTRLSAFKAFAFPVPQANTGSLLLISENKLALFLMGVVAQLSKRSIYTFASLDEGLAFLARTDASLPWYDLVAVPETVNS